MQSEPTASRVLTEIREVVREVLTAPTRTPGIEPLLTTEQVAELLEVSPKTVRGWVETKRIPHYKPGARADDKTRSKVGVRFRASDLEAWLETMKVDPVGMLRVHEQAQRRRRA